MRTLNILNLGAGVQSTTLYLMSLHQDEPEFVPVFDYAIFADTGEEPRAVYEHLEWLKSLNGPPILSVNVAEVSQCYDSEFVRLGDALIRGTNSTNQGFASIPAFTSGVEGVPGGMTRRQCTREFKTDVIERTIRYKILGLKPRQRFPEDVHVIQSLGLSFDEPGRIIKVRARFLTTPWADPKFFLFEMEMSRRGCRDYLKDRVPHRVPRSACVFCPFRSNEEWRDLRDNHPDDWARAVEVDEGIRATNAGCVRGLDQKLYVHRSCLPLRIAPIDDAVSRGEQRTMFDDFDQECEGMCGV